MSGVKPAGNGGTVHQAVAKTQERSPIEILRAQLVASEQQLRMALPDHIKPERFQRVVMTVAQQNPDLVVADRRTLLASCMKCAADGLIPDGREAALVIFNTKVKQDGRDVWIKAVQYMPMLAGIQKRIRNSGEVSTVEAHVVYEHDVFVWRQGMNPTVEHTPKFPGDRGKPIGAYALAKFKDGTWSPPEVMDVNEIERVRAVSKSKDSGPWVSWWSEMARKTVFKRLSKWLPTNAEVDSMMRHDDETTTIEGTAVEPVQAPSKLDALEYVIEAEAAAGDDGGDFPGIVTEDGA